MVAHPGHELHIPIRSPAREGCRASTPSDVPSAAAAAQCPTDQERSAGRRRLRGHALRAGQSQQAA
jgi:hypothetical protein